MLDSPQSQVGGTARVAKGTVVYQLGAGPCSGTGIEWTPEESREALDGPVADVLDDGIGTRIVTDVLGTLTQAEFDTGRIEAVAATVSKPSYRLGEAIAEAYLSSWRDCTFQWLVSHDLRQPTGSRALRYHLIRYLRCRCAEDLRERFIAAARRHMANPNDCRFVGVLVRDALPVERDLRHALGHHQHGRPEATQGKVLAIFLSPGHLDPVVGDSTTDGGTS